MGSRVTDRIKAHFGTAFALWFGTVVGPVGMHMDVEAHPMNSRNFEFLRSHHRALADLVGFAEHYAHNDLFGSLIQRAFRGEL